MSIHYTSTTSFTRLRQRLHRRLFFKAVCNHMHKHILQDRGPRMSLSSSSSVDVMAAAAAIGGPPASPARELALFVLDQTLLGLRTAAQAVATVVKDPYVVSLHKHILIPLLGLSLLFYLGTIVPLRLILWFTGLSSQTPRVQQWYWVMNTTIPILINIILRFVWYAPLDRCYLAVLSSLDESLTADLRKRAPRSGWDIAKTEAKRWMSVVLFLPIYWLLSWIPLVGRGLKFIFKVRGVEDGGRYKKKWGRAGERKYRTSFFH